ncbi:unnamed protein product [Ceutorhynchus assimilis]|uniref:Regulatory protein zeste n=1 Tax=Ceutorhynchus assimilis TaxID=467358 RepID=A0A9N9QLG9_9CUCU|nr:unnamed protein product [Ceutorhynchus assimilis]
MEEKKGGSLTREQKKVLIQFIEDHPELKTSKFSKDFTFKKGQALWEEISSILNAMPGANKGWIKWRKTWHDIKNAVKTKSATIRRHLDQTGGGPPINEEITNEDQKILNLISPVVIEGMPEVAESMTVFTMPPKKEVKPSTSSSFVPVEVDVIVSNPRAHNSYNRCDFCLVKGEYLEKRMTFNDIHSNSRTDLSFSTKSMETYHKGESPIEKLRLKMVTNFPEFNVESVESNESGELPAAPQPLKIPQQNNKPKETPSKQDVDVILTNKLADDKNKTFLCNGCKKTEDIAYVNAVENVEEAELLANRGPPRHYVPHNPFEESDDQFVQIYRLTKNSVNELIDIIRPFMVEPNRVSALNIERKVGVVVSTITIM